MPHCVTAGQNYQEISHWWIFCFRSCKTRSSTRFSIVCSQFSILYLSRNQESRMGLKWTVNLLLNGTVGWLGWLGWLGWTGWLGCLGWLERLEWLGWLGWLGQLGWLRWPRWPWWVGWRVTRVTWVTRVIWVTLVTRVTWVTRASQTRVTWATMMTRVTWVTQWLEWAGCHVVGLLSSLSSMVTWPVMSVNTTTCALSLISFKKQHSVI